MIVLRMDGLEAFEARYHDIRSGPHLRVDLPKQGSQSRPDQPHGEEDHGPSR
jgi:hypothetical protein